jgi:hypothetical protein
MRSVRLRRICFGLFWVLILSMLGCMDLAARSYREEPAQYPSEERPHRDSRERRHSREPVEYFPETKPYRDPGTGQEYLLNPNWRTIGKGEDGSGQIEVVLYESSSTQVQQFNALGCQVAPGFIVVGGGAYADYGSGAGALLTETRPLDEKLTTWVASSKDHLFPCPHTLSVYAVGLRLRDRRGSPIPRSELLQYFRLNQSTSAIGSHVHSESLIPRRLFRLGGGARVNYSGAGNLLVRSVPTPEGWAALSMDHTVVSPASLTAYTIYFTTPDGSIPGFGRWEYSVVEKDGPFVPTRVGIARHEVSPGWVLTGPGGGDASYRSPPGYFGRLLFGIRPEGAYVSQVAAYTKDHQYAQGGITRVSFIQVRKQR